MSSPRSSPAGRVRRATATLVVVLLGVGPLASRDIYVDQSFGGVGDGSPSAPFQKIQDGVAIAFAGDRVVVARGTYHENVVVNGIEIALLAPEGPSVTTIDGGGLGSAVVIQSAGSASLTGFTVTGGQAPYGAGVYLLGGTPTITRCIITGNHAVASGGSGGLGGGVYSLQSAAVITNSLIRANVADIAGGGIELDASNNAVVAYDTVVGNSALSSVAGYGSGVDVYQGGDQKITSNVIASNTTPQSGAGGLEIFQPGATFGLATVEGNVLFGNSPTDFASTNGPLPAGNLVADPKFVNAGAANYRLRADSPGLDNAVATAPAQVDDLDGNGRPVDGDQNGSAAADRGCYEQIGEISGLVVSTTSVVSWAAAASPSAYHFYRGNLGGIRLGNFGTCQDTRDPVLTDTQFTEPALPPAGSGFTFLASFSRNGAESSLGRTSAGAARVPSVPCP